MILPYFRSTVLISVPKQLLANARTSPVLHSSLIGRINRPNLRSVEESIEVVLFMIGPFPLIGCRNHDSNRNAANIQLTNPKLT